MATIPQYVRQMRTTTRAVARKLGADIVYREKGQRVILNALLVVIGTLVKLLVTKGVFTDAELVDALDTVRAAAYDEEPDEPVIPADELDAGAAHAQPR